MKKTLVFIVVFCLMLTLLADTVVASSYSLNKPPLSMKILGKTVTPEPILYKDQVLVPLRAIGKALGYQVNYGEKSKTMDLISKDHKVIVTVGYINASINGAVVKMDIAPMLSNNNLYVPLTFVQKNFKYSVEFSKDKNQVSIDKPGTANTASTNTPATNTATAAKPTAANSIMVMDKKVNTTEKALIKGGLVYIPARLVGEGLGYKVTWSASTNTMTFTKQNESIVIVSGKTNATINKKAIKLDGAPYLSNAKLYMPLTIVSKNMGLATTYNNKQNSVAINKKTQEAPKPETPKPPTTDVPLNAPGIANIINMAYDESGGFPQVNISADSPIVSYNAFTMTNPNRLVIDINSSAARTDAAVKEIQQSGLQKIRIGQLNSNPAIVRVVVDLDSQRSFKVVQSEDKKTISILYANVISPVSYYKEGDLDVIEVKGTSNLDTSFMELDNPSRIVFDVKRAVFDNLQQSISASSDMIKAVRIGQFDVGTARVVLDVADDVYFNVKTTGNTSKIYISSYPFEFVAYNKYYNTGVLSLNPGRNVQYNIAVDELTNTVNVTIPQDLKLDVKKFDINDNLIQYVDYKTESINGSKVTTASIKMQPAVQGELISDPAGKLIKLRFKRKISSLQQLTIVIDAGHGGKDPGAIASDGTREKDLNLDVAKKLEKHLNAMGFKTIMTRTDDTFIELGRRTDIANTAYADFFISIHFNAFNQSTNGIETLYYPNTVNQDYTLNNRKIAEVFHQEVIKATGRGSRGINARPNLYVLNKTKMPAILSELGFLTNPAELALIKTDKYKEDSARALAVSILKYFRDIEGVKTDIDPNSIYSWPYENKAVQTSELLEILQSPEATEQQILTPAVEEVVQPQN